MTTPTDIFFVPAPERVVVEMLKIARIESSDVVMDLGSGEGQILIAAARDHGARGIGIELDPELVAKSQVRALDAGVAERLEFFEQDFFQADLRAATVLMLYLLDSINIRLRPKILAECRPGVRVVTYSFEMGEWLCDAHTPIAANGVSLWIVPANLTGIWRAAATPLTLTLRQRFQELAGSVAMEDGTHPILTGRVRGDEFTLSVEHPRGALTLFGHVRGEQMEAIFRLPSGEEAPWQGERELGTQRLLEEPAS